MPSFAAFETFTPGCTAGRNGVVAWDAHAERLEEIASVRDLLANRKQTVEQAKELQGAIQVKPKALQNQPERERKIPGDPASKSASLANLAAA